MEKDFLIDFLIKFRRSIFPRIYLEKAEQALKLDDRQTATFLLKRVLEIDPGNRQAKKFLTKDDPVTE